MVSCRKFLFAINTCHIIGTAEVISTLVLTAIRMSSLNVVGQCKFQNVQTVDPLLEGKATD